MKEYTNIIILKTNTTLKQKQDIENNIDNIINSRMVKRETTEIKQLAYNINRNSKGVFVTTTFKSNNREWKGKLDIFLKQNKQVLKFITYTEAVD